MKDQENKIDDYGKKHLIEHLAAAEEWDKIEELRNDPVWGKEARKYLNIATDYNVSMGR